MEHKQLLTVFNSLPVGIGFLTADGTLVRCNESFCRIFGADSQTLLGNKVNMFERQVKSCVKVPLAQYEYDAFVSLTYNIGGQAFCSSTLVKKLNAYDYEGACNEILKWDKFRGKPLPGLTKRRQQENKQCLGQ